ncbi:hypothetical protein CR162_02185 [Pseudoroseomonas rhizosphaerae]|uniref:protein-glutamate methylesterase n=1 Tax=Teichococcus rhizosphaerae TaxID=1335062 RepID=A0A2C7AGC2_9PROT|nr:chemotaxis protein CheB [Pseudoroseomonas rhizosphaerae]PHK96733.1 hypothetical protein CR162_02185 [Pseudoroseomonas rhizosphaerae]
MFEPASTPPRAAPRPPRRGREGEAFDLLLLGASTGGPDALAALLGAAGVLPVPCVVAQHMPAALGPDFARHLAARTGQRVLLGTHGARLSPGEVLLLPGGTDGHLACTSGGGLALRLAAGAGLVHPSVDRLFRSAALAARRPLAVVMSGMGQDGAAGIEPLLARGGLVLVQEAASCVVSGMPAAAPPIMPSAAPRG